MTGHGRQVAGPWPLPDRFWLRPGVVTRVPGTNCELLWHGDQAVMVYRRGGLWDLSPLVRPGRVLVWERLVTRRHLGWWPIMPLATRSTYRAGSVPSSPGGTSGQAGRVVLQTRSNESR